jgi:AcrR family transcriptional regulator
MLLTMTTERRDKLRSRELIVAAAEQLLVEDGQANFTEIALEAGVSPATVYRHFPDRSHLLSSLMDRQLEHLELTLEDWTLDATSFERLLRLFAEEQAKYQGLIAQVRRGEVSPVQLEDLTRRTRELFRVPLARAKEAGAVRKRIGPDDVISLLRMIDGSIAGETSRSAREKVASEAVDIVLDGVRG